MGSQRGIAWRFADGLSLRQSLGVLNGRTISDNEKTGVSVAGSQFFHVWWEF
jgi:hypothetical protein